MRDKKLHNEPSNTHKQAAHVALTEAYNAHDMPKRRRALDMLSKTLSSSKSESVKAISAAARDQNMLLEAQQELEGLTGRHGEFIDLPAAETVKLCFRWVCEREGEIVCVCVRACVRVLCVGIVGLVPGRLRRRLGRV